MPLPVSGTLSFSQIATEFGRTPPVSLSQLYAVTRESWVIHCLKDYRIYVLESPYTQAVIKSPANNDREENFKSLPVVCRGTCTATDPYGNSELYNVGEYSKHPMVGDYTFTINPEGKYCCIVSVSQETVELDFAVQSLSKVFQAGQTVLLLDGSVTVNGIEYSEIKQFDLNTETSFITSGATLAWTVI